MKKLKNKKNIKLGDVVTLNFSEDATKYVVTEIDCKDYFWVEVIDLSQIRNIEYKSLTFNDFDKFKQIIDIDLIFAHKKSYTCIDNDIVTIENIIDEANLGL